MKTAGTIIQVGIADMSIARAPDTLRTSGLGSCVGVVLYDLSQKQAGMAHIMLPDSSLARQKSLNRAKYADTAIPALIEMLEKAGSPYWKLKAKLAGGAQMFKAYGAGQLMRIGPRNVEAVKRHLHALEIPIVAADVGGNSGRTIQFNPETGELVIRTVNKGISVI